MTPPICRRCDSVGRIVWHAQVIVCPECRGSGWGRSIVLLTPPSPPKPKTVIVNGEEMEIEDV